MIIAGDLSCLRLPESIRCTHGIKLLKEPHKILLIVWSNAEFLAVCFDEESPEEASEGV